MPNLIDDETRKYLSERFSNDLQGNVSLTIYSSDKENEYAQFAVGFTSELASLNDKISVKIKEIDEISRHAGINTDPSILIGAEQGYRLKFNGVPAGHEAGTFVEAVIMVSQGTSGLSEEAAASLKKVGKETSLQVFVTPTCPHCPHMAQLAFQMAVERPDLISAEIIEASENPELSQKYGVSSVPQQLINWDKNSATIGVQAEEKYLEQILTT